MFDRFKDLSINPTPTSSENSFYKYSVQETSMDNNEILTLINQQRDNFISLTNFINSKNITPSLVFLPQTLKQIDAELTHNQELLLDCLSFLDIVKTFSLVVYGDIDTFTMNIMNIIVDNRICVSHPHCLASDAVDDFLFKDQKEALGFIDNNKLVLSVYIFSLISVIFYESQN